MKTDERELLRNLTPELVVALKLLPRDAREDLMRLAIFLLAAHGYTRHNTADKKAFMELRNEWETYKTLPMAQLLAAPDDALNTRAVKHMCRLKIAHQIEDSWIEAFLDTMESDLVSKRYATMEQMLMYVYGAAEAVGLMVARVLRLPKRSLRATSLQSRAVLYVHLLRSIKKHEEAGQRYFSKLELKPFHLESLDEKYARDNPQEFKAFTHAQLSMYDGWRRMAQKGFLIVPRRYRRAILAMDEAYYWVALKIEKDPLVIYTQQLRPSRSRLLANSLIHLLD